MAAAPRWRLVTDSADGSITIAIAGQRLKIVGDSGLEAVEPAFAGVVDSGGGAAPHATLEIETADDPAGTDPWRDRQIGAYRYPDGALAVVSRDPSSVESFAPGTVPRLHLSASPEALASGDLRAQPAHRAIAQWLASPTVQLIHAAAVSLDGRGVLLVGVGGRGKTTTALACAQAGFSFLGDDLCVVETGSPDRGIPPRIHGLYATAKLNSDSREWLGAEDWPVLGTTWRGKAAVALPPQVRFERSVPLVAILGVGPDRPAPGDARRVSAGTAMGMLAATALLVQIGSGKPALWMRAAASIAREVQAFEMGLEWDREHVVDAVRSVLESVGGR